MTDIEWKNIERFVSREISKISKRLDKIERRVEKLDNRIKGKIKTDKEIVRESLRENGPPHNWFGIQ